MRIEHWFKTKLHILFSSHSSFPFISGIILISFLLIPAYTNIYTLQWDAYAQTFIHLRWIGSALHQGVFPGYFPYMMSGYPLLGDIQAGLYNPLFLLSGYLFPDSVRSLNFLFVLIFFIIYINHYFIGKFLLKNQIASLYFALSISVCGFVLGHAEHISYNMSIVGFSFFSLGFIFSYQKKFFIAIFMSTFGVITFGTASYPTLTITAIIFFIGVSIYRLIKTKSFVVWLTEMAPLVIGSILGIIYSSFSLFYIIQVMELSGRGQGVSMATHLAGSLHPSSLLNFFLPIKIWKTGIDLSMNQFHLLILSPFFLGYSLYYTFNKKTQSSAPVITKNTYIALISIFILFTLLNLGKYSPIPIREIIASFEIFRLGRFPGSEFNYLALLILAFLSAIGVKQFLYVKEKQSLIVRFLILILIFDALAVFISKKNLVYKKLDPPGIYKPLKVIFKEQDQHIIDNKKYCPAPDTPIYVD